MPINLTESIIQNLPVTGKPRDVRDNKITGFMVRVNVRGSKTYFIEYDRGKRIKIGSTNKSENDYIPLAEARLKAQELLVSARRGEVETKLHREAKNITFKDYIDTTYYDWMKSTHKSCDENYKKITRHFSKEFGTLPLNQINLILVEKWIGKTLKKGQKPISINRLLAALKGAMTKAVDWDYLESNPIKKLKLLKADNSGVVRYLSDEESERLYSSLPSAPKYVQTMIIISINTGLRKGELLSLKWENVKLGDVYPCLTVESQYSKSGKTRTVPLNKKALAALQEWQKSNGDEKFVFTNPVTYKPYTDIRKYWEQLRNKTNLENFRWHDLRHECASKLVMKGVDIYTVAKVLGHSDITMTQRYAHLAPKTLADAVARLD